VPSASSSTELACEAAGQGAQATLAHAEDAIQRRALLYDRQADRHYDRISAWIKATRGSDPDASLYYLAVMLEGGEDPRFIARRMVILASEDVGNADPQALLVATGIVVGIWILQRGVLNFLTPQGGDKLIAWAILFGFAQQALTSALDTRASALIGTAVATTPAGRPTDGTPA